MKRKGVFTILLSLIIVFTLQVMMLKSPKSRAVSFLLFSIIAAGIVTLLFFEADWDFKEWSVFTITILSVLFLLTNMRYGTIVLTYFTGGVIILGVLTTIVMLFLHDWQEIDFIERWFFRDEAELAEGGDERGGKEDARSKKFFYKTEGSKKYHAKNCGMLKKSERIEKVEEKSIEELSLSPCKMCKPKETKED